MQVIVEKCKIIQCDLWRYVALDWKVSDGKAKMVPTVQYLKIQAPRI